MTKSGITVTRDDVAKLMSGIKRLTGRDVLVGVPSDKTERKDGEPINNAELAYIHTHGATIQIPARDATIGRKNGRFAKAKNARSTSEHTIPAHEVVIPPRPFLIPGIENAEPRVVPRLKQAAKFALQGDSDKAEIELHKAGLIAQNEVRAVINAGVEPALSESTLRSRRARGRTGTVPLIDKGEVRNSITYVVRQK